MSTENQAREELLCEEKNVACTRWNRKREESKQQRPSKVLNVKWSPESLSLLLRGITRPGMAARGSREVEQNLRLLHLRIWTRSSVTRDCSVAFCELNFSRARILIFISCFINRHCGFLHCTILCNFVYETWPPGNYSLSINSFIVGCAGYDQLKALVYMIQLCFSLIFTTGLSLNNFWLYDSLPNQISYIPIDISP